MDHPIRDGDHFHPQSLVGRTLGPCRVTRFLREGGFAYAYSGMDNIGERFIKLSKRRLDDSTDGGESLRSFEQEWRTLRLFQHAQIPRPLDHGEFEGRKYIVTEYVPGPNLYGVLQSLKSQRERRGLGWEEVLHPVTALALLLSALEPLRYVHGVGLRRSGGGRSAANPESPLGPAGNDPADPSEGAGIGGMAHRDLSPANLILCSPSAVEADLTRYETRVHIVDFGAVKTMAGLTTLNANVLGTTPYLSPMRLLKQLDEAGSQPFWRTFRDTQHDVHSLGCIFKELLTGERFIKAEENIVALVQIREKAIYERLYAEMEGFGPGIGRLIRRSIVLPNLEKEKNPQYPSAAEMAEEAREAFAALSAEPDPHQVLGLFAAALMQDRVFRPALRPSPTARARKSSGLGPAKAPSVPSPLSRLPGPAAALALFLLVISVAFYFQFQRSRPQGLPASPSPSRDTAGREGLPASAGAGPGEEAGGLESLGPLQPLPPPPRQDPAAPGRGELSALTESKGSRAAAPAKRVTSAPSGRRSPASAPDPVPARAEASAPAGESLRDRFYRIENLLLEEKWKEAAEAAAAADRESPDPAFRMQQGEALLKGGTGSEAAQPLLLSALKGESRILAAKAKDARIDKLARSRGWVRNVTDSGGSPAGD